MNSFKSIAKSWLVLNAVFLLLIAATRPALADANFDISDIAASLPHGWAEGVTALLAVLYGIAQVRAVLPPSLTSRVPMVIMKALDFISANYRHASNQTGAESKKWDRGPIADGKYQVARETAKNKGEMRGSSIESAGDHLGDDSSDFKRS